MQIISEKVEGGVVERRFDLNAGGEIVPGIQWLPEKAGATLPIVLIGHGGTQHKRVPNVVALARKLVTERGYGAVALDAPGHGERMSEEERDAQRRYREQRAAGGELPREISSDRRRSLAAAAPKAVSEWKALIDLLESSDRFSIGPLGYWGVSMGTSFGVPLLANEPRIKAAVLGLNGLREGNDAMRASAEKITVPVLFLFQWDDQLVAPPAGVALWKSFGSAEKTMHINPGPHVGIPRFEQDSVVRFFMRHLEAPSG